MFTNWITITCARVALAYWHSWNSISFFGWLEPDWKMEIAFFKKKCEKWLCFWLFKLRSSATMWHVWLLVVVFERAWSHLIFWFYLISIDFECRVHKLTSNFFRTITNGARFLNYNNYNAWNITSSRRGITWVLLDLHVAWFIHCCYADELKLAQTHSKDALLTVKKTGLKARAETGKSQ